MVLDEATGAKLNARADRDRLASGLAQTPPRELAEGCEQPEFAI